MTTNINKFVDHTSPLVSQHQDAKSNGTPETPRHSIDAQWGLEAESRLAAYKSGQVKATPLEAVLAKYPNWV